MKKRILITGARGGIGLNSATKLAKLGHEVIVTVHREESIDDVLEYAKTQNIDFYEVSKLDVTLKSDREKYRDYDIDVLINNAAIGESGSLGEIDLNKVRANFETNVFSLLELTQVVLPKMIEKKSGNIIIMGSLAGRMTTPFLNPYCMTKYALESAAESLRAELKELNINVTLIAPGSYDTGFNKKTIETKYNWMNEESFFSKHMDFVKSHEKLIYLTELKNTDSIANKVVRAATSKRPCYRYVSPWWQGLFVHLKRIINI